MNVYLVVNVRCGVFSPTSSYRNIWDSKNDNVFQKFFKKFFAAFFHTPKQKIPVRIIRRILKKETHYLENSESLDEL
jgi:hypothetical protein